VALRNDCDAIRNLQEQYQNVASLVAIGYGSAANPANPGGVSDAQLALNMINYLNTVAGVYRGTATQGTTFDFSNATCGLWAGQ
jgi:hypothetical protein